MKASIAFIFFMLFLAGIAFVNLRGMQEQAGSVGVSTDALTASTWRPERLREMRLPQDTEMRIHFAADGNLSGNGGCNRFFGSYALTGEGLAIGELGATRMACPEPAASFEISFMDALQSASKATIAENRLVLKNSAGDTVVRLIAIANDTDKE
jgi:heat shock protein HslJ